MERQKNDLLTVQQLQIDIISIEKLDFITLLQATRFDELEGTRNDYKSLFNERPVRNSMGVKLTMISRALDFRSDIIKACNDLLSLIDEELNQ